MSDHHSSSPYTNSSDKMPWLPIDIINSQQTVGVEKYTMTCFKSGQTIIYYTKSVCRIFCVKAASTGDDICDACSEIHCHLPTQDEERAWIQLLVRDGFTSSGVPSKCATNTYVLDSLIPDRRKDSVICNCWLIKAPHVLLLSSTICRSQNPKPFNANWYPSYMHTSFFLSFFLFYWKLSFFVCVP